MFVGHHKNRLIESIRSVRTTPFEKIILVTGEQESSGEQIARKVAEATRSDLEKLFDVHIEQVDKKNVIHAASQIIDLIKAEKEEGNEEVINVSGALRTFSIGAYIAGCLTGSRMVTSIPQYDAQENEIGIEETIDLPVLPILPLKGEPAEMLRIFRGSPLTFDDIIISSTPHVSKQTVDYAKERSRLTYHLKNLEEMGLIKKEKSMKGIVFSLTELGELVRKVYG
jgi:CRISPR-associated protein Csa3